jgi:hypothetical protein
MRQSGDYFICVRATLIFSENAILIPPDLSVRDTKSQRAKPVLLRAGAS